MAHSRNFTRASRRSLLQAFILPILFILSKFPLLPPSVSAPRKHTRNIGDASIDTRLCSSGNPVDEREYRSRASARRWGLPPRDEWQRVPEILSAMGDIEGKRVADVAARQGYLTRPLSRKVGLSGRVYAVDIGEVERRALAKLAADSLPNIEVIAGSDTTPNLPDAIDAVVGLNPQFVDEELRAAGFEIVDRQDKFIVQPFPQWMFIARRPLT